MPNVEAELEVLKNEMANVGRSLDALSSKIDDIKAMQIQLVRLQEQHDSTKAALDRAFTSIKGVSDKTDADRLKLQSSMSFVKGFAFAGALIVGGLQFYLTTQIDDLRKTIGTLNSVDRRLSVLEKEVGFFQRPKAR